MATSKELPLAREGEPTVLSRDSTCSNVFEISTSQGNKVYKEVKEDSRIFDTFPGNTLSERAALMNKLYSIVKAHLGDYYVKPEFLIAKNEDGRPCIMMVQDKVNGVNFDEVKEHYGFADESFIDNIDSQKEEIFLLAQQVLDNPEISTLPEITVQEEVQMLDISTPGNLLVTPQGDVRLIDW